MIATPVVYEREHSQIVHISDLSAHAIHRAKPLLQAIGLTKRFVFVVTIEGSYDHYLDFRELALEIHEAGGQVVMAEATRELRESLCCDTGGNPILQFENTDEAIKAQASA